MSNYWEREKIRLRAFEEQDLDKYIRERSNPDGVRQLYENTIKFPLSEMEIKKNLDMYISSLKNDDKRLFVIEEIETKKYAGEVTIWFTDRRNGVFRYGIFLDKEFRGKGYAKEALIIILDYYFNELNYQKCSVVVYAFNKISQHFHEKFGFIEEGHVRSEIYARGKYHDIIYYGLLKNEFKSLYSHDFI